MFFDNKYKRIYDEIIANAKSRSTPQCYIESHHIVPQCLGGTDAPENLVVLTFREHYLCHWLLTKFVMEKWRLQFAFFKMAQCSSNQKREITSRMYARAKSHMEEAYAFRPSNAGWVMPAHQRKNMSDAQSNRVRMHHPDTKKQKNPKQGNVQIWLDLGYVFGTGNRMFGEKNSRFGKQLSDFHKQKISEANSGKPSWNRGIPDPKLVERNKARTGQPNTKLYRTYEVTEPDGSKIIVNGLSVYCKERGLNQGNISSPSGSKGYKARKYENT